LVLEEAREITEAILFFHLLQQLVVAVAVDLFLLLLGKLAVQVVAVDLPLQEQGELELQAKEIMVLMVTQIAPIRAAAAAVLLKLEIQVVWETVVTEQQVL
jgi:hypothetical protein